MIEYKLIKPAYLQEVNILQIFKIKYIFVKNISNYIRKWYTYDVRLGEIKCRI